MINMTKQSTKSLQKLLSMLSAILVVITLASKNVPVMAQETIDVGETGWDVKRPVMAAACEYGCPWGELGDFVRESMQAYGYSVILCRNCNRMYGPGLVSGNKYPPPLDEDNLKNGTNVRVDARIDFGVTASAFLHGAYNGTFGNAEPYDNLRLIAKIEDPFYFLLAVRKELGINNMTEIREQQIPLRILGTGRELNTILDYYGISPEDITSWGGNMRVSLAEALKGEFDLITGFLASPAMNPESSYWTTLSQRFDLYFMELPDELLSRIAHQNIDAEFVEAQHSLLRGMDRRIRTLGRSGESVFARDDTPEQAAYDLARAIDENKGALKWFIRVYFYDPETVWQNFGVPLHPGAERYYREVGYIKD
jgi:TRAP-type uncharacterized transport system substrate-binding protein